MQQNKTLWPHQLRHNITLANTSPGGSAAELHQNIDVTNPQYHDANVALLYLMNWGKTGLCSKPGKETIEELQNENDDGEVADAFQQAAKNLSMEQFVYFANCIEKFYRKCWWLGKKRAKEGITEKWTFTRGDVFGIADWVRKRSEGVTIR